MNRKYRKKTKLNESIHLLEKTAVKIHFSIGFDSCILHSSIATALGFQFKRNQIQ